MAKSENNNSDKTKRHGIFTKIILFLFSLPMMIFGTMVFSILVEWALLVGCDDNVNNAVCKFTGFQSAQGVDHSRMMLNTEAGYINTHFKESLMGTAPIMVAGTTLKWADDNVFKPLGIERYKEKSEQERGWAWEFLVSGYTIVKIVLLRVCVLLLSVPAYVIFAGVGLATGLVKRDLRKFGAGAESTDRYELSLKLIQPSIVLCFIIYLSWPNSINPAFVVVPFAGLFGYALHLTTSNYKKRF